MLSGRLNFIVALGGIEIAQWFISQMDIWSQYDFLGAPTTLWPSLKPGLDWTGLNFNFLILVMFTALEHCSYNVFLLGWISIAD